MVAAYHPLDLRAFQLLRQALGDTPETVISTHLLRDGRCQAYVAGSPSQFDGAIVQSVDTPAEPSGFGGDPQLLWNLLKVAEGWECVLVDSECASVLGEIIEREIGTGVRYLDDICTVLTEPVLPVSARDVRQLAVADLGLLESAVPELRASCWASPRALLSEGVVAAAIVSGRIVATALTAACSERHAEVGVYSKEAFRGRGYASAAASLVVQHVQETGRIPVWSAGEHNLPSLSIAQKLGFVQVSRRTYVTLDYD